MANIPIPGSKEATAQGCTCGKYDQSKRIMVDAKCPIHDLQYMIQAARKQGRPTGTP